MRSCMREKKRIFYANEICSFLLLQIPIECVFFSLCLFDNLWANRRKCSSSTMQNNSNWLPKREKNRVCGSWIQQIVFKMKWEKKERAICEQIINNGFACTQIGIDRDREKEIYIEVDNLLQNVHVRAVCI